jgi:hypothetical protein
MIQDFRQINIRPDIKNMFIRYQQYYIPTAMCMYKVYVIASSSFTFTT